MSDAQHLIKKLSVISLCVGLAGCGGNGSTTHTNAQAVDVAAPVSDWTLVWSDEFDGAAVDTNKWTINVNCDGGGNNEQQCYTDSAANVYVADGSLHLVALAAEEGAAKPYTSGKLDSKMKGDFKYGRFEMRAKMPSGQGAWPAFWMMPSEDVYGGWPHSGEIDIVEAVNLKASTVDGGVESHVHGTLHYGYSWPDNQRSGASYHMADANPADDYHLYAIEWQQGEIRWYVDGYLYQTQLASETRVNSKGEVVGLAHQGWFAEYFSQGNGETIIDYKAPYDQAFYLILNNAVGGDWPEAVNDLGVDPASFDGSQSFEVDYVRVYECAINPQTGAGCETVRAGYKEEKSDDRPDGALVLGKAPIPALPGGGGAPAANLTIFEDEQHADWPIWDCCGGSTPTVEIDDEQHGAVAEFVIGEAPTVMGFMANEGVSFDGSGLVDAGTIEFDLKVLTSPGPDTEWKFKIESTGAATAVELDFTESDEGQAPETGVWQHYTFKVADLAAAGLDVSSINVLMMFPAWGTGEGAVYRIDNVKIAQPSPGLVLFDDASNVDWPIWDCCGGSTPVEVEDDETHNIVAEFAIGASPTVMGFLAAEGKEFDASALVENGTIAFDMKMVSAPGPDAVWKFKVESVGAATAVELDLSASNEGHVPVLDQWQRYTFNLKDLAAAGLDVSAINVVMMFPEWGTGEGAVYRVDNAAIGAPSVALPELMVYHNAVNPDWPSWDCCGGSTPVELADEDEAHGQVTEFAIGASPTVMGFLAAEGAEFDASAITASGVVEFDLKVMTSPGPDTVWKFKIESFGAATAVELDLTEAPVTGQWQRYTFKLADLAAAGLEVSAINVIMMFPAWGTGEGAVYRVDNVRIGG